MLNRLRFHLLLGLSLLSQIAGWAQPVADFSIAVPTSNCNPAVYSFTNNSTGTGLLTYEWNFGVYPGVNSIFPDPSTTYLNCGTFQVKLVVTDGNGVKDSSTQSVDVRCSPTPSFTSPASVGCLPHSATFASTSNPGSGTITTYVWDFGDGNSGTGESPTHTYQVAGCKNVTLIVTNSFNCTNDTTMNSFVCIDQPPVSSFTSTEQTACAAPFDVTYNATSSSGTTPYSYQWIFNGGIPDSSTSANSTVTYNANGSFSTTLITTDANGCADTAFSDNYILIDSGLVDFTMSAALRCAPVSIPVNAFSAGNPLTWQWTASAPATITNDSSANASISFPDSGTYNICIATSYADGCIARKCSTITVNKAPVADFGVASLSTCVAPFAVTFADSSTGSNLRYNWSFPGGIPPTANTLPAPVVSYDTCGNYSVSLTVTDDAGCTSTAFKTDFLEITCPQATYTVTPNDGCLPLTSTFNSTASTGNPISWLWDFDDPNSGAANTSTLQNPQHTFFTEGCYNVRLTTTNAEGCVSHYELEAAVCAGWRPHANFSANPPLNCASQPVYFTDSSTGTYEYTEYFWGFHYAGDSVIESVLQNPNYTYWDGGIWDITLIVSNYGCADTITKDDYVRTMYPLASPEVIYDCDDPLSVVLDGSASPGAETYDWIILGGTPANASTPVVPVTYPAPGDYTVALNVTNDSTGCSDLQNIVVHISTVGAQFEASPLSGCAPLQSCFSNLSLNSMNYLWTMFDSTGAVADTVSTDSSSPCFVFENPGVYSAQLIVTDSSGCVDTLYKPDYIKVSQPTVDFVSIPLSGCAPLQIQFVDSSTTVEAGIVAWNWNFGDATADSIDNVSGLQNPAHLYNDGGSYPVRLTITDSLGCVTDTLKYVHVNEPIASLRYTSVTDCQGQETCFTADLLGQTLDFHWDFGDGATANVPFVCHRYLNPGAFNVELTVTDTLGCTATQSVVVTNPVHALVADFVADTTTSICPPLVVSFTNLSTAGDSLTTWRWDFGDGQVSSLRNPFHIYTRVGRFTVTLIATNAAGCSDIMVIPDYIIITGPTGYIATPPVSGCVPHQTCMSAVSASAVAYTWNLGDGMVMSAGDSICYTYTRTGSFYPELILSNGANCVFSLPMGRVDVTGTKANFGSNDTTLCSNGTINFTDSSAGAVTSWFWDFGDPASGLNNSTVRHPSHFYSAPGIYNVLQRITSVNGCVDSTTRTITVYPPPAPAISTTHSAPCASDSVRFTAQNNAAAGTLSQIWNFGDPQSGNENASTMLNPAHRYAAAGSYSITYTVIDNNGCAAADTLVITAHPLPIAAFTAYDTCLNRQPVNFTNNTVGATRYLWNFGDGDTSTLSNPTHAYRDTGEYLARLIAENDYCSDTTTEQVEIYPLPVAAFSLPISTSCGPPAEFAIVNHSANAVRHAWDFGNNTFSTLDTPVAAYATSGTFTILLTATNQYGCIDTATNDVTIHPIPVIAGIDIDPAQGCPPLNVTFHADVTDADFYTWDLGVDSGFIDNNAPDVTFVYPDTGSYTISLYVNSVHECRDTLVLTDTIKVHSPPVANFDTFATNTAVYPYDGTVVFTNRSINAVSYIWEFGDGNTSTEVDPTHRYDDINSYTVLLTAATEYGCTDTASKQMRVIKKSLYAPNALHPESTNGNELVKVWKPAGIGLKTYKAQVFDQWGKLLWESEELLNTEPAEGWDGNYLGKPCPQDVYVWKIDAIFLDGRKWEGMSYGSDVGGGTKTIGSITLVR